MVEQDLSRGAVETASLRAKAHIAAGGRYSDGDWCRWLLWDKSAFTTIIDDGDDASPRAIITNCVVGWPDIWADALSEIRDPTPTVAALQALLGATRRPIPIDLRALNAAAALAETPWQHFLVGTGYRIARSWTLAEKHLRPAFQSPDLFVPASFDLLLVYAQSAQLAAVARIYRDHFTQDRSKFKYITLNVMHIMYNSGDFTELYELVNLVEELLGQHFYHDEQVTPFRHLSCLFQPDVTMDLIHTENKIYSKILDHTYPYTIHQWRDRALSITDPPRIGYFFGMGNDLFSFPALHHRDRARYRTYFYFHNVTPDASIMPDDAAACDVFRALGGLDDDAMFRAIQADDLDLLIVLDCVGLRARDVVVRRRPARRIAYYGNVFGPMAAPAVDALLLPETMADCFKDLKAMETIVPIPDWVNLVGSVTGRFLDPLPAEITYPPVLGTPANGMKLNQAWFDMAARVLNAVPGALLRLDIPTISQYELVRVYDCARRAGIDGARLIFHRAKYSIGFYERISSLSLALDSFPLSCYFSAMQVLSAGLPLLTFPGAIPSGRGTATILNAADLGELICRDQADMEEKAIALLRQPEILVEIRRALPARMRESRLNDLNGVARAWEAALDQVLALPVRDLS